MQVRDCFPVWVGTTIPTWCGIIKKGAGKLPVNLSFLHVMNISRFISLRFPRPQISALHQELPKNEFANAFHRSFRLLWTLQARRESIKALSLVFVFGFIPQREGLTFTALHIVQSFRKFSLFFLKHRVTQEKIFLMREYKDYFCKYFYFK